MIKRRQTRTPTSQDCRKSRGSPSNWSSTRIRTSRRLLLSVSALTYAQTVERKYSRLGHPIASCAQAAKHDSVGSASTSLGLITLHSTTCLAVQASFTPQTTCRSLYYSMSWRCWCFLWPGSSHQWSFFYGTIRCRRWLRTRAQGSRSKQRVSSMSTLALWLSWLESRCWVW